jgi:integrase
VGPWVFSPDAAHERHVGAEVLGHRFAQLHDEAGVPDATLHRLRHTVATFLVARGQVLAAQARLGHADAATTLREYAHALPLTDGHVADAIDAHLHLDGDGDVAPDAGLAPQSTDASAQGPRPA